MAPSSCIRIGGDDAIDLEAQLAADWRLFQAVESGPADCVGRCWQIDRPAVVIGRHNAAAADILDAECRADGVSVVRRFSGGGSVVLGPGCLNFAVAASFASRAELADVTASFRWVLETVIASLAVAGLTIDGGTDLVLDGRKVSGNAQRRGRRAFIHHGTLLYAFDPALATRYLKEPARQPAYRARRPHANFLGNIPLSGDVIRARLEAAWR